MTEHQGGYPFYQDLNEEQRNCLRKISKHLADNPDEIEKFLENRTQYITDKMSELCQREDLAPEALDYYQSVILHRFQWDNTIFYARLIMHDYKAESDEQNGIYQQDDTIHIRGKTDDSDGKFQVEDMDGRQWSHALKLEAGSKITISDDKVDFSLNTSTPTDDSIKPRTMLITSIEPSLSINDGEATILPTASSEQESDKKTILIPGSNAFDIGYKDKRIKVNLSGFIDVANGNMDLTLSQVNPYTTDDDTSEQ